MGTALARAVPGAHASHHGSAEALLALIAGIIFGPIALDWFSPYRWVGESEEALRTLTFQSGYYIAAVRHAS